MPDLDRVI